MIAFLLSKKSCGNFLAYILALRLKGDVTSSIIPNFDTIILSYILNCISNKFIISR